MKKPELVIIKYGGGLITHKDQECHANIENINRVSGAVKHLLDHNNDVIVIHGAGSFGHLKGITHTIQKSSKNMIFQSKVISHLAQSFTF